jgi:hypothetical protein
MREPSGSVSLSNQTVKKKKNFYDNHNVLDILSKCCITLMSVVLLAGVAWFFNHRGMSSDSADLIRNYLLLIFKIWNYQCKTFYNV